MKINFFYPSILQIHLNLGIIPEMSIYFPVVPDKSKIVSVQEKIKSLKLKKIRNLMTMNATYKQEVINTFVFTKEATKKLMKRIDDALK